jgi:2-polyprenyl-6-methoxyphenol hydroxylase-like FAD-dependent oxidoreductase
MSAPRPLTYAMGIAGGLPNSTHDHIFIIYINTKKINLLSQKFMKKVLIIGSGIGGCAAAIAFSQIGWKVTVLEKFSNIFTEGAGILLYSNALKSLDELNVFDQICDNGCVMKGNTLFYDENSLLLGSVGYRSIDSKYPAYVGIDRQKFLEILYNRAKTLGADFQFNKLVLDCNQDENKISVTCSDNDSYLDNDLLIAADGTNSRIRNMIWKDSESMYSGFGLYHSMHDIHPNVAEKITVVMPDKRFGIIPMSKNKMYLWGSIREPIKKHIDKKDQPAAMHNEFKNLSGFIKEIIDDIDDGTYVHYTSVEEVSVNTDWHKDKIVLLGDAAHASLPFMAQGAAMAMQDACVLTRSLSKHETVEDALIEYKNTRKPVVDVVQRMSRNIGLSYSQSTVDLEKIQANLDNFYSNRSYFK